MPRARMDAIDAAADSAAVYQAELKRSPRPRARHIGGLCFDAYGSGLPGRYVDPLDNAIRVLTLRAEAMLRRKSADRG